MNRYLANSQRHSSTLLFCTLLLLLTNFAYSQQWQYVYGRGASACWERGVRGVQRVSTGGYIAAGFTRKAQCGVANGIKIYVERTDNNGSLIWASTYSIRFISLAADIQECASGDFIITGYTATATTGAQKDIFLLKISSLGVPLWVKTYGLATSDEFGEAVIEATMGNGLPSGTPGATAAGDLVVCGFVTTNSRAVLFRTDLNGNLIWDRLYCPTPGINAEFHDLIETTAYSPGDIIAVGSVNLLRPKKVDAFIVRVSGSSGTIGAAPQGAVVYGDTTGDEILYGVTEEVNGPLPGTIFTVGSTTSPLPGSSSTNKEILIHALDRSTCLTLHSETQTFGDNGSQPDIAYDIKEINAGPPFNTGNFIITGSAVMPNGFGGGDAFMFEMTPGLVQPTTGSFVPFMVYGGVHNDEGRSVAVATGGSSTDGFIICGSEQSNLAGAMPQLDIGRIYIIKTDNIGISGCHERSVIPETFHIRSYDSCVDPVLDPYLMDSTETAADTANNWQTQLCLTGAVAPLPGISDVLMEPSPDMGFGYYEVSLAPNPVRAGASFQINLLWREDDVAKIEVSDISGKTIYTAKQDITDSRNVISVSTMGWSPGLYLLSITIGDQTVNRPVAVH